MEYKLKACKDGRFSIAVGNKSYMLPLLDGDWPNDETAVRYLAKTSVFKKEGCVFKTRDGKWWGFLPEGEEPTGILFCTEPVASTSHVINYPAHPIYDGNKNIVSFAVLLGAFVITAPYLGEYDNYMECDRNAEYDKEIFPETGFVIRAAHNKPGEYIFYLPEGMSWSAGGYEEAHDVYIVSI
ncbi:MAG: hypothetical protein IJS47_05485 [Clostridia bacterium]|nr:hypothetical protein [Clostridia bacterium]